MIERTAQYSRFKLNDGYTREKVISEIGPPVESKREERNNSIETTDTYIVEGRVFDCSDYWATAATWVMSFGLLEIYFFPKFLWEAISEKNHPTKKYLDIWYWNDNYVCQRQRKLDSSLN